MIFRKLFGDSWRKEIPRLYPSINGPELCDWLDDATFEKIKQSQLVMICPFFSEARENAQLDTFFGAGLTRLMIRDLMLIRNISVQGPEDTPAVPKEYVGEFSASAPKPNTLLITGECRVDSGYRLAYEIWKRGEQIKTGEVADGDFHGFLRQCAETLGRDVGGDIVADLDVPWSTSRPKDAQSLARLGHLCVVHDHDSGPGKDAVVRQAIDADPGFGIVQGMMTEDHVLQNDLKGYELDPYNAQSCFGLFTTIWKSNGTYEPEAVQFLRRATELSPGHGKAHMCAPHAAHPDYKPRMIRHSELGYRLLPGNPFAINNYISNLAAANAPTEKLMELAKEGIGHDPYNPGIYQRMIQLFLQSHDYKTALVVAEQLHALYEPVMNERALYSLKQNPQSKAMIESGEWDPVQDNRDLMKGLKAKIAGG